MQIHKFLDGEAIYNEYNKKECPVSFEGPQILAAMTDVEMSAKFAK